MYDSSFLLLAPNVSYMMSLTFSASAPNLVLNKVAVSTRADGSLRKFRR